MNPADINGYVSDRISNSTGFSTALKVDRRDPPRLTRISL